MNIFNKVNSINIFTSCIGSLPIILNRIIRVLESSTCSLIALSDLSFKLDCAFPVDAYVRVNIGLIYLDLRRIFGKRGELVCGLVLLLRYRFVRVVDGEEGGHSYLCIDRGFNPWGISCSYCNMLSKMVVLFCEIILISYSSSVSGLPSVLCPRRWNSYL